MISEQERSMQMAAVFGHAPLDERKEEIQKLYEEAKNIWGKPEPEISKESVLPPQPTKSHEVISMKIEYPIEPFNPLKFSRLPAEYNIHATEDQYNRMNQLGVKLKKNNPKWSNQKLMRKVFEAFPSVKISLKTEADEQSIHDAGQEDTSGTEGEHSTE